MKVFPVIEGLVLRRMMLTHQKEAKHEEDLDQLRMEKRQTNLRRKLTYQKETLL